MNIRKYVVHYSLESIKPLLLWVQVLILGLRLSS